MSCVSPIMGGSWFPTVVRQMIQHPWSNLQFSDPMHDIQSAKDYIYRNTGRPPVAMTTTAEAHDFLSEHPDILDRMKYLQPAANRSRTITIAAGTQVVSSMTYLEAGLPNVDALEQVVGLTVQISMLRYSLVLRDSRDPLAIIYNDAMAVELRENE